MQPVVLKPIFEIFKKNKQTNYTKDNHLAVFVYGPIGIDFSKFLTNPRPFWFKLFHLMDQS